MHIYDVCACDYMSMEGKEQKNTHQEVDIGYWRPGGGDEKGGGSLEEEGRGKKKTTFLLKKHD